MGVYDEFDIDDTINRNDFTVEQAAAVFKKAQEAVKSSDSELVKKLMDAGFSILKLVATLA
jgi:hypothetical protein